MVSVKDDQELAGAIAQGMLTIADSLVMRDDRLRSYLDAQRHDAPLISAYTYWTSLCEDGVAPDKRTIDPTEIDGKALPHIVMIDAEENPQQRFRYRLVGTAVTQIFGADYTGRYMDEMGLDPVFGRVQKFYAMVCEEPKPALLIGSYLNKNGLAFQVARLAMPLSNDGRRVDTLFCCFERT